MRTMQNWLARSFVAFPGVLAAALALPAEAGPDRMSFLIGSEHVGATYPFVEKNPGVFLTWELENRAQITAGVFHNSYGETAQSLSYAWPLTRSDNPWQLHGFASLMHYPEDGRYFSTAIAGDVVGVGGLQLRRGNFFVQAIPCFCDVVDVILGAGVTFSMDELFGRK